MRSLSRMRMLLVVCLSGAAPWAGGCDPAASGYYAIHLGRPLPKGGWLPRDARRTDFGLAYVGDHNLRWTETGQDIQFYSGLVPPGKYFCLRALTDDDGAVLGKSYALYQQVAFGWSMAFERRLVVEVLVPEDWLKDSPATWSGEPAFRLAESAWPMVRERIRWGGTQHLPVTLPAVAPGEEITSTSRLLAVLEECTRATDLAEAGAPSSAPASGPSTLPSRPSTLPSGPSLPAPQSQRHVGRYVLLAWTILSHLPSNARQPQDLPASIDEVLRTPGAFSGATHRGWRWSQTASTGRTWQVRNVGAGRVRIEVSWVESASPYARP